MTSQLSGTFGNVNTAGLTSAQIDALFPGTPADDSILSDVTNGLVLVRQNGVWQVPLTSALDTFRSSEAGTLPRQLVISSFTPANQQIVAGRAFARSPNTFTKIRARVAVSGSGLTDSRIAVWGPTGTFLTSTANLVSAGALGSGLLDNQALLASVVAARGDVFYLGVITYATGSPTLPAWASGAGASATINALPPLITWALATSWTGSTIPNLSAAASNGAIPWVELIP